MTKIRRRIAWWALGLALIPIAVYGSFPVVASTLLKEGLSRQGFEDVTVVLGYPLSQDLLIDILSFEREIAGQRYQITLNGISLEYQISELLQGQLERIVIKEGKLVIESPNPNSTPRTQDTNASTRSEPPSLTLDELLTPFPIPPFDQLVVGKIAIHRSEGDDPLQRVLVKGSIDVQDETLHSQFEIQGSGIPLYSVTLSGASLGDATFAMLSPASPEPTLIRFSSQATPNDQNMQLEGSLNIHIPNVIKLVTLFMPIDRELSRITGHVAASWRGHLPRSVSVNTIMKDKVGTIDGTYQIHAGIPQLPPYAKDLDVEASGTFSATHDELSWTLSKDSHISSSLQPHHPKITKIIRSIVPMNHHKLSIDVPKPLSGHIRMDGPSPSLSMTGRLHGDYTIKDFPVTLQFSLDHLSGHSLESLRADGHFFLSGTLNKHLQPEFPVRNIKWQLAGDISIKHEKLSLALAPTSFVQTALLPLDQLMIPQIDMNFLKRFMGTFSIKEQTWDTSPLLMKITAPQITWNDTTLTTQRINLTIHESEGSLTSWKTDGHIVVLGMDTTINSMTPPTTNAKLVFSGNPELLNLNLLTQTSDTHVSLYGKLRQHFITGEGRAQLKLAPIEFAPSSFSLQNAIKPWPYPFEITTGTVGTAGNVSWKLHPPGSEPPMTIHHGEATISVQNLGGVYDAVLFEDLSTEMTFVGHDTWSMPNPGPLTLGRVKSGVEVSDISMNVHLEPLPNILIPSITISDFSSHMFDGQISSDLIAFDYSQPENHVSVDIKGIDIGEILKLEQQEGLEGTGLLDGTIPMLITKDGIEVPKAIIAARPPGGMIRYRTSEATAQGLADTNSNLNLVLQALDNFQYDVLRVQAHYQKNGTLLLETRLEGKNPDLGVNTPLSYNGHAINLNGKPIHFNLNIEENIPALMKSLRIAEGIGGQLEDLIQQSGSK